MKKRVYFYQPAHHYIFQGHPSYWLPYSVGCLWSYALTRPKIVENYILGDFFFERTPIKEMMENVIDPDVAVFSCYLWNMQYNRKAAKAVKEKFPNCLIVFGGPEVTKRPEENKFFEKNPFVDCIVNGEGEVAFADLLEGLVEGKKPEKVLKFSRLKEVAYPSPYSNGIFDELIKKYPDYHWQAVLETNRGCPYQCTFCDWGSAVYAKIVKIREDRVISDIDWMGNNKVDYVFIADANFGILYERDKKFAKLLSDHQTKGGYPKVVLAQWAKNGKEKVIEIAKIFFNGHNRGFTMSVQSMDEVVLEAVKRKNMETTDMTKMLELCQKENINSYSDLILGLPYETKETWRNNYFKLLELGQHSFVDVAILQILENSEINTKEARELHQFETMDIPRLNTGVTPIEGDILESENIVVSTKYMPKEDFKESYLFGSIIMHFHYISGSTSILSRFLRKYKNLSYETFYSLLESKIKENKLWICQPHSRLKTFMDNFLNNRVDLCDEELLRYAQHNIWLSGKPLILNPSQTFNDLLGIYTKEYCQLESRMYEQLIDFQKRIVFDKNQNLQYPYTVTYDYDFVDFINNNSTAVLQEKPTTVLFEYAKVWESEKQFLEHAFFERRSRDVTNVPYKVIEQDQVSNLD